MFSVSSNFLDRSGVTLRRVYEKKYFCFVPFSLSPTYTVKPIILTETKEI